MQVEQHDASAYLNDYGDLINVSAALNRGLLWHLYGRSARLAMGYEALEWVDSDYDLIDPLTEPELLSPEVGYGVGSLIYPNLAPSIRIKLLREGIEDTRLLDLYGSRFGSDAALSLARCYTPGVFADQHLTPEMWDNLHDMVLSAIAQNRALSSECQIPSTPSYSEEESLGALDDSPQGEWSFNDLTSTLEDGKLEVLFDGDLPYVDYDFSPQDWSEWQALRITITNVDPYFTELDVALVDDADNYLFLRGRPLDLAPSNERTFYLPVNTSFDWQDSFDWTTVVSISLEVTTSIPERDANRESNRDFPLGSRRLIFSDFSLVR